MAGPWFTVHRVGEGWQVIDRIWISDEGANARAVVELKVEFAPTDDVEVAENEESRNDHAAE